jgi:60 kDa SS-A/Ro ribonucleoprotein
MANRDLFSTARARLRAQVPEADSVNRAGGKAYSLSPQQALAQYAATGTLSATFYADAAMHLETALDLVRQCSDEYVAKAAVWSRERAFLKDMPAFLLAALAARGADPGLLAHVLPRVADNPKMVRNVVQILRSGVLPGRDGTLRRSIPRPARRFLRGWLEGLAPARLLNASVGADPTLADLINLLRPRPRDAAQRATFAWARGDLGPAKPEGPARPGVETARYADVPDLIRKFDQYQRGEAEHRDLLSALDHRLLTSLPLGSSEWTQVGLGMPWHALRMNLATLARHGVLRDPTIAQALAEKLRNPDSVRRARAYPYQLLATYLAVEHDNDVPMPLKLAVQDALDVALENIPQVGEAPVVCLDVSGSMDSPVTGQQKKPSKVTCRLAGALITAAILRKNPNTRVLAFHTEVYENQLNPRDSVLTNAQRLAALPSGGTDCAVCLAHLITERYVHDTVIYISDYESWYEEPVYHSARLRSGLQRLTGGTGMSEFWAGYRQHLSPRAKMVCIDLQPNETHQMSDRADTLRVGGWSDAAFDVIAAFARGEYGGGHFERQVEQVDLTAERGGEKLRDKGPQ